MSRRDAGLERLTAQLRALSGSLPELIERVRARAAAEGRPEIVDPALEHPRLEGRRLAAFADYLEQYSRVEDRTLEPLDLRVVLEQAVALARGEIAPKARLAESYLAAPLVRGNARQLGQVFVSMLINAAQAIAPGKSWGNLVGVGLDTSPSTGWARIAIADTGAGIAEEDVGRIFEPLYSTKRGAGMGIGLSIVREIIEGIRGRITITSELGFGTLFIIDLPPAS